MASNELNFTIESAIRIAKEEAVLDFKKILRKKIKNRIKTTKYHPVKFGLYEVLDIIN